MVFVKPVRCVVTVEIDASNHPLKHGQWHAQQRPHFRRCQAFHVAQPAAGGNVDSENRDVLRHHLARDGAADPHQLRLSRLPRPRIQTVELLFRALSQKDRAPARGHDSKNQVQQLGLQFLEIADRMHHPADL